MSELEPSHPGRSLAARLRDVRVGIRSDLDISRHVFRNTPRYIVRDPVTFQSHSLAVADYAVFIRIGDTETLGDTFARLVEDDLLGEDREQDFYQFVLQLHQLGFLALPVSDAQSLYKRHSRRRTLRRRRFALSALFLRIPLCNPDSFLDRTVHLVRPVFSTAAFVAWLVLIAVSLLVVTHRWDGLTDSLSGVLVLQNLPVLWTVLVLLKIVHELGHAYACKRLGGCVPEMGAYLILFTPCAYMDATDSWRFPRMRDRLSVCLAGMYVESMVAMIALLAWAMTGTSSFINSLAYQTMLLASVTTVAFNANPLMRFDGYYILSDILEIPNLRTRSARYLSGLMKRVALGIAWHTAERGRGLRALLLTYGISAAAYRVLLVLGIGALIATRVPVVGMSIAAVFVAAFVVSVTVGTARYLLRSEETAPIRPRAAIVCLLLLVGVPAGFLSLPLPGDVVAAGVLEHEGMETLYAQVPGFVRAVHAESGDAIQAGDRLIELEYDQRAATLAQKAAEVDAAALRMQIAQTRSESSLSQERQRLAFHRLALDAEEAELAKLQVRAQGGGRLVDGLRMTDVGRYVRKGEAVATVSSGATVIRMLVTGQDLVSLDGLIDQSVECRSLADPGRLMQGTVVRVAPVGSRGVDLDSLTHLAGGAILVDDRTGEAGQPYFEITIRVDDPVAGDRSGATFLVRLPARSRLLGDRLFRQFLRFRNRLRTAG